MIFSDHFLFLLSSIAIGFGQKALYGATTFVSIVVSSAVV
jgi:hypothetical protein